MGYGIRASGGLGTGTTTSASVYCPPDVNFLFCVGSGAGPPSWTWDSVALTYEGGYGNNYVYYMKQPPTGTRTIAGSGTRWSGAYFFLSGVNLASPWYASNNHYGNPMSSFSVASAGVTGKFVGLIGYNYWDDTNNSFSGTNVTTLAQYASGFGNASYAGKIEYAASDSVSVSISGASQETWVTWRAIRPALGAGGITVIAKRWEGFLRDLRAGLVPPDVLRERYRGLVTI